MKNVINLIKKYKNVKRVIIIVFNRLQLQNKFSSIKKNSTKNYKSLSIEKNYTKKSKIKSNYIIQFVAINKKFFVVSNIFVLIFFKQKFIIMILLRFIFTFSIFVVAFRQFETFIVIVF